MLYITGREVRHSQKASIDPLNHGAFVWWFLRNLSQAQIISHWYGKNYAKKYKWISFLIIYYMSLTCALPFPCVITSCEWAFSRVNTISITLYMCYNLRCSWDADSSNNWLPVVMSLFFCFRRHSYRTGQDIENCGTCRDCACIIYRCVCVKRGGLS